MMCKERITALVIGILTALGLILGVLVSPWWLLINALFSVALLQAAFTGKCGITMLLRALKTPDCAERSPFS